MVRAVPPRAIPFVQGQEGRPSRVYYDVAGHLTGGWGHEITPEEMADWPHGKDVPDDQAVKWLASDLDLAVAKLYRKIRADVIDALTENQWIALIDFAFNVGTPGKDLWTMLNARHFDQVPTELGKFVYANEAGKEVKVEDLVRRRSDEVKLWGTDEPGSTKIVLPSSVTRNISTPGVPADPKPRNGIGPAIGTAIGTVTVAATQAGQAVKSVSDALSPYADLNDHVKAAIATLALVSAGLAVVTLALIWLKNRAQSSWQPTTMAGLPAGTLTEGNPNVQPPAAVQPGPNDPPQS